MRVLGPAAFLSAALALSWASALWEPLTSRVERSDVVALPWVGY